MSDIRKVRKSPVVIEVDGNLLGRVTLGDGLSTGRVFDDLREPLARASSRANKKTKVLGGGRDLDVDPGWKLQREPLFDGFGKGFVEFLFDWD